MTQYGMLTWLERNTGNMYGNFINGEWMASSSGKTFPLYHVACKDQLLGYFADSTEEDVNLAVEAAHEAFKSWSKLPAPERSSILMRFADLLERHSVSKVGHYRASGPMCGIQQFVIQ